jgi:predicted RNA binding protein YcfA (HicA-like mRNA interferase family)
MPRKIRRLIKDLKAGGRYLDHITGSHRIFKHPKIGRHITIAGKDNEYARHYNEKDVREAVNESKRAKLASLFDVRAMEPRRPSFHRLLP